MAAQRQETRRFDVPASMIVPVIGALSEKWRQNGDPIPFKVLQTIERTLVAPAPYRVEFDPHAETDTEHGHDAAGYLVAVFEHESTDADTHEFETRAGFLGLAAQVRDHQKGGT